jgi:tetratricopeptide (TPR) repeat protein
VKVFSPAGLAALALLLIGCKHTAIPPSQVPRYAVLRFENLSADPALNWVGRAVAQSLSFSLAGAMDGPVLQPSALNRLTASLGARPSTAPGISTERAEAVLSGATRVVTGYVERHGPNIRLTAADQDVATGKTLRMLSAEGVSPTAAMDSLARQFSARARQPPASNSEALRDWSLALDSPLDASPALLQQALRLDPDFGAAWVALSTLEIARGDRAAAQAVIQQADRHSLDPLSRANLELGQADLTDDRAAKVAAMRKVAAVSPGDTVLLRTLADAETSDGQFKAAASDWQKVTVLFPDDALAWNSLGYARSYAGDYSGALTALGEYEKLRPKEANPSDSIGDLNYSFRKFREAAASYLEGHKKQPDFEQGGDLYKAAWAKFQAGDKADADRLFKDFSTARAKSSPGVVDLVAGDWLYRTGRRDDAIALLRKLAAGAATDAIRIDAYSQLTVWDLLRGDRVQAALDQMKLGSGATAPAVFMTRFAALPSASVADWEMRAERMIPSSVMPLRQLCLGYALVLDGKREAAIPVWEQIAKANPATNFFPRAVLARLRAQPLDRPLLPDPNTLNQFAAIPDNL